MPIDYATTDEMRAILSASTLKTCSQGSTQLRILSLPENGKVSLNANANEKHCEKNVSNVVEEVSFWCQCSDVEWPFFLFLGIFEVTDSQIKTYFWRNGTDLNLAANCFISCALFTQFSNGTPKVLLATGLSSEQKVI